MSREEESLRRQVKQFHREGFLILRDALDATQISVFNQAIDRDVDEHPGEWLQLSEAFRQTVDILPRTSDFDLAIENPRTLRVLRILLGEQITLEEFSIMLRDPSEEAEDVKSWHRDIIRDFERRMEIEALSLVYYLTDVSQSDHCFSIIPETHNRQVDMKPSEVREGSEYDVTGPAGTALIFHARCLHAGKLKSNSRQRRTLHLYFGRADQPRTSEWTTIPERLYRKEGPKLPPLLYSKHQMTKIVDGTGKKPRDADPSMSTVEQLKLVQVRANAKAKQGTK